MTLQRPRFTRHLLAEPTWLPRLHLARDGTTAVGLVLLAGRHAYSVTWARRDPPEPPEPPEPPPDPPHHPPNPPLAMA